MTQKILGERIHCCLHGCCQPLPLLFVTLSALGLQSVEQGFWRTGIQRTGTAEQGSGEQGSSEQGSSGSGSPGMDVNQQNVQETMPTVEVASGCSEEQESRQRKREYEDG